MHDFKEIGKEYRQCRICGLSEPFATKNDEPCLENEERFQAAIDEIKKVCKNHGVFIIGTCDAEGIYGEMSLGFSSEPDSFGWSEPDKSLTNEVKSDNGGYCYVDGIGEVDIS